MKCKLIILIWLLFAHPFGEGWGGVAFSQNLVPNPSFEDTIACPIQPNGAFATPHLSCQNWYNPTNTTPDYLNGCASHRSFGNMNVPNNDPSYGWQYARTGNAYIAMGIYYNVTREFVQVELISPLITQHKYCVEFFINKTNKTHLACNNMGMYFSDIPILYSSANNYIGLIPQINNTTIVTDTVNWVEISGEFIASGGEQYITIGNFFLQANTDTIDYGPPNTGDLYYIDDVSVVDCTGSGLGVIEPIQDGEITIYPNPNAGVFEVKSKNNKIKSVTVYNLLGELVYSSSSPSGRLGGAIDITGYANGLYFVEVQTEKGILRKKFIKQ